MLIIEEGGVGGVAQYTAGLAAALARLGLAVDVATARDHDYPPAPGVTVHALFPYVRDRTRLGRALRRARLARPIAGAGHLATNLALIGLARRSAIVHVQGEEWPPLGAVQALILRLAGRRIVYTPHNTFDRGDRSYPTAHRVIRSCVSRIVVHSVYDRHAMAPAQAAKAVVIPLGEYGAVARQGGPVPRRHDARSELGVREDELLVLLFGQLRPDKGVRDLLLALAQVDGPRLILAGREIGALAQCSDLLHSDALRERVLVREGHIEPAAMTRLFAAADVVAVPYLRVSASAVLALAYAYSRPVLVYPTGGLPEYVLDGQTGWLCRRADPDALAEQLRRIVAAGRGECRGRGAAGRRYADERLSWDSIAVRTRDVYASLLDGSRR